jgi:hypothetical protein
VDLATTLDYVSQTLSAVAASAALMAQNAANALATALANADANADSLASEAAAQNAAAQEALAAAEAATQAAITVQSAITAQAAQAAQDEADTETEIQFSDCEDISPPLNGQLGNCEQYSYLSGNQTSDYSGYPPNYCTPVCNEGYVLRGTSQCFDGTFVPANCVSESELNESLNIIPSNNYFEIEQSYVSENIMNYLLQLNDCNNPNVMC